jgi:hypothetical protein
MVEILSGICVDLRPSAVQRLKIEFGESPVNYLNRTLTTEPHILIAQFQILTSQFEIPISKSERLYCSRIVPLCFFWNNSIRSGTIGIRTPTARQGFALSAQGFTPGLSGREWEMLNVRALEGLNVVSDRGV